MAGCVGARATPVRGLVACVEEAEVLVTVGLSWLGWGVVGDEWLLAQKQVGSGPVLVRQSHGEVPWSQ